MSPEKLQPVQSPMESFIPKQPTQQELTQVFRNIQLAAEAINKLPLSISEEEKTKLILEKVYGLVPSQIFKEPKTPLGIFKKKIGMGEKSPHERIERNHEEGNAPFKYETIAGRQEVDEVTHVMNYYLQAPFTAPAMAAIAASTAIPLFAAIPLGIIGTGFTYKAFDAIQTNDNNRSVSRADQQKLNLSKLGINGSNLANIGTRVASATLSVVGAIAIPTLFNADALKETYQNKTLEGAQTRIEKVVIANEKSVEDGASQNAKYAGYRKELENLNNTVAADRLQYDVYTKNPPKNASEEKQFGNIKSHLNPDGQGSLSKKIKDINLKIEAIQKENPDFINAQAFRKKYSQVATNFNNEIKKPENREILGAAIEDLSHWDLVNNWNISFGEKLSLAIEDAQKNPTSAQLAFGIFAGLEAISLLFAKIKNTNSDIKLSKQIEYQDELKKEYANIINQINSFTQSIFAQAASQNDLEKMTEIKLAILEANPDADLDKLDLETDKSIKDAEMVQNTISSSSFATATQIAASYRKGLIGESLAVVDSAYADKKDANGSKENKELKNGDKLQLELQNSLRNAKAKDSTEAVIKELEIALHKFANVRNKKSNFSVSTALQQLKNIRKPKNPDLVESHLDNLIGVTNVIKKLNETKMTEPVKLQVSKFIIQHQIDNPDLKISYGQIKELIGNSGVLSDTELANFESNINERRFDPKEKLAVDQIVVELSRFEKNNFGLPPMNKGPNGIIKGYISKFSDAIAKTLAEINKLKSLEANDNTNPKILQLQQNLKALSNLRPSNTDPEKIKTELQDKLNKIITVYQS